MQNPFENLSRWIMVKLSLLGALLSAMVTPASASDAEPLKSLTLIEFISTMWLSIWTPAGAQAVCFASIGGFIGLVYYTGTFFYKRWLFNRYPITKEHEEELRKE